MLVEQKQMRLCLMPFWLGSNWGGECDLDLWPARRVIQKRWITIYIYIYIYKICIVCLSCSVFLVHWDSEPGPVPR